MQPTFSPPRNYSNCHPTNNDSNGMICGMSLGCGTCTPIQCDRSKICKTCPFNNNSLYTGPISRLYAIPSNGNQSAAVVFPKNIGSLGCKCPFGMTTYCTETGQTGQCLR